MSWAEFVLRSISFREDREFEMIMTREIAYQSHCMQYLFGKEKPPKKDVFWKIGKQSKDSGNEERKKAYLEALEKFKKESK